MKLKAIVLVLISFCMIGPAWAKPASPELVTIYILRHAEVEGGLDLTAIGRKRAELLTKTLENVKFTHVLSSHTRRSMQTIEGTAAKNGLQVIQPLKIGDVLRNGEVVTEETSRRADIEPMASALGAIPSGSTVLVGANSENVFAILNGLGVPVAANGETCARGDVCVPCVDKTCFPATADHMWILEYNPASHAPVKLMPLRYSLGWVP